MVAREPIKLHDQRHGQGQKPDHGHRQADRPEIVALEDRRPEQQHAAAGRGHQPQGQCAPDHRSEGRGAQVKIGRRGSSRAADVVVKRGRGMGRVEPTVCLARGAAGAGGRPGRAAEQPPDVFELLVQLPAVVAGRSPPSGVAGTELVGAALFMGVRGARAGRVRLRRRLLADRLSTA